MEDTKKRFLSHVRFDASGCWIWQSAQRNGYGQFRWNRKSISSHRTSYLLFIGEVEKGKHLHHACKNKLCVNPEHLALVTPKEHCRLDNNACGQNAAKTHCKNGHEFTPENTKIRPDGARSCKICCRAAVRRSYEKKHPDRKGRTGRPKGVNLKTHCPQGHPLEGDNLIVDGYSRKCRICTNAVQRDRYQRRAQQEREAARERYKRKAEADPGFWRRYPSRQ